MAQHAPDWVSQISDETLKRRWGVPTLLRGKAYAAAGHVIAYHTTPTGAITATVRGTGLKVYRTEVNHTRFGLDSSCDCPIGQNCKHAVAVLLTLRGSAESDRRPAWEHALAPLLPTPAQGAGQPGRLGLEFSFHPKSDDLTDLRIRPLRDTPAGWARTRGSWGELISSARQDPYEPRHADVLRQLAAAAGLVQTYGSPAHIRLVAVGPILWPLLRRCLDVGIYLVPGEQLREVRLGEGPVRVWLDAIAAPEGIDVIPTGDLGPTPPGGRRFLIGYPAHGIAELRNGSLLLAPLAELVPEAMRPLVAAGATLRIPPEDVGRFRSLYLTGLSHEALLLSSDGSCPLPEPSRPRLTLRLSYLPEQEVGLSWDVSYGVGPDAVAVGLRSGLLPLPRDYAAERELESRIASLLRGYWELIVHDPEGLAEQATLRGVRAARFMTEMLPRIEALGVAVSPHGEAPAYAHADAAPVVTLGTQDTAERDWFNLHVRVTVAGHEVDFETLFRALACGDDALLLEDGTWFSLDHRELDQLRHLIAEARALADPGPRGEIRISPYQAGLWEDLLSLGAVEQASERWRQRVSSLLSLAEQTDVPVPAGIHAELRPYQRAGYAWLATLWDAGLGGVLADDMGLGKTLQTLALIERARQRGELAEGPVLVVAPASVVATWGEEAARFAPNLNVVTIQGGAKKRGKGLAEAVAGAHVVVTSYTLLRHEADAYHLIGWRAMILDEAQFVKNHRGVTYQVVRRIPAGFTVAITGTPLENSLADLWSLVSLAAPGLFPRAEVFAEQYRKPIENDGSVAALATLRQRLRPFMLRRTKAQVVAELPEKVEQLLRLDLAPAHRRRYDQYLTRERSRVLGMLDDMDRNRMAIFRALTTLRQLALDPRLVDPEAPAAPSAKIAALIEQLAELSQEGHRALVFSSFTGFLGLVREELAGQGIDYAYLDGSTRNRAERVAEFRRGEAPVFLISLKAGGFGLTLTEADYVFVLDPWWNPAAENQAIDRAHRIGQTRAVNVYKMVAVGTIEEKVVALQERKRTLFDSVMETGEFRSGTITADDIRDLLG